MEMNGFGSGSIDGKGDEDDVSWLGGGFGDRKGEEKDYDRDPEFAEILGNCLDDPDKAQSRVSSFFSLRSLNQVKKTEN